VTVYPRVIQEALAKYPETVEEDSSYEDDETVLQKYVEDPITYIMAKDERKRDAIEMNAEPFRIRNARTRHGDKNYKSFADYIIYEAVNVALAKQGMPREMTEERRWGKHIKNADMLKSDYYQKGFEQELVKFLSEHCSKEPDIFVNDRDSRDRVLSKFEMDVTIMREHPHVIESMFIKLGDPVPENLRIEGRTASAQRDKMFG